MTRRRIVAAAVLALASGAGVLAVVSTIDPTYQAEASATLRPVVGEDDLLGVLRLRQHDFRLGTSPRAPFLPEGERALRRIAAAAAVPPDNFELLDTDAQPLFPAFREPPRSLRVVVQSSDPERAARGATAVLDEYLDYRRRWYARELSEVRRYLARKLGRERSGVRGFPSGPEHPEEGVAAASLLLRLERDTFGPPRPAAVPAEPVTPRKWRDVLVAAIIGALLGLLLPRGRVASWPRG